MWLTERQFCAGCGAASRGGLAAALRAAGAKRGTYFRADARELVPHSASLHGCEETLLFKFDLRYLLQRERRWQRRGKANG